MAPIPDGLSRHQFRKSAILFSVGLYAILAAYSGIPIASNVFKRWPQLQQTRRLRIQAWVSIILLASIWPISVPALWIARGLIDSDWSICGLDPIGSRRARNEQTARDVELNALARVKKLQEAEQKRINEEHQKWLQFQETRERMQQRMNAELGRTGSVSESTPTSSSSPDLPAPDASDLGVRVPEEMPDATVSKTTGGSSIHSGSKARKGSSTHSGSDDGFIIVPRPVAMPNANGTRILVPPPQPVAPSSQ